MSQADLTRQQVVEGIKEVAGRRHENLSLYQQRSGEPRGRTLYLNQLCIRLRIFGAQNIWYWSFEHPPE